MASKNGSNRSSSKVGEFNAFDDPDPVGWMFFTGLNVRSKGKNYLAVMDIGIPEGEEETEKEEQLDRYDRINGKLCQLN